MISNAASGFFRVITFIVLLKCATSGRYIGDSCTLRSTHESGRCKFLADCPKALEDLQSQGIHPQNCGFDGVHPIVCCVENIFIKDFPSTFQGSKSKQKCHQYRDYYKKTVAIVSLPDLHVPVHEECEFLNSPPLLEDNRARPNEFPHMAAIGYDGVKHEKSWLCSGALISEQFVLTAAHCLTDRPHGVPKHIRIGDLDLNSNLDDTFPPQKFKVAGIFIHPEFRPPSFYNDIGLLKMDRPAKFNLNARPACLNTHPTSIDKKCIIAAWGKESHSSDVNAHLLKETLHSFSHAECENVYKNMTSERRLKNGIIDETQLCAITRNSHDMCEMGTGVLQIYNKEEYCMYTVVGITSFGRTCGIAEDVPDVFTRVSAYTQWIEGIVWPS